MSSQEIIALERTNTLIQEGTLCIPEHSGADHYQLEINNSLTKNFYFDISTYKVITQDQNIVVNIYFGKGQDLSYLVSLGRAPDCIY